MLFVSGYCQNGIISVALESTGDFWQNLYTELIKYGFDITICNGKFTKVPYSPPREYLFLDQREKLKVASQKKKNIAKFDLKPEDIGFVNSFNISML
ncbi:MAG: hypothetical protein R6W78_14855 [Bacteroidales bacterium]